MRPRFYGVTLTPVTAAGLVASTGLSSETFEEMCLSRFADTALDFTGLDLARDTSLTVLALREWALFIGSRACPRWLLPGVEDADVRGVVSADGGRRENPAGWWRGGVFVGEVSSGVGKVPVGQSTTSVTAERAAVSSTRFLPVANAATRDCRARLLTARG